VTTPKADRLNHKEKGLASRGGAKMYVKFKFLRGRLAAFTTVKKKAAEVAQESKN